jgi:riboflavin synthase
MFSGIIEELGQLKNISRKGNVTLFKIEADKACLDIKIGDSISVNGACLTVIKNENKFLSFEVIAETLKITNLGLLRINDKVNLERALKVGDRISGHFVSGHIDCLGVIRKKNYIGANLAFEIAIPTQFTQYVLPKGSIAVDGISLTIADKKSTTFHVYVIPRTLKNTTLGFKGSSDKVNLEFDILAKKINEHITYVALRAP